MITTILEKGLVNLCKKKKRMKNKNKIRAWETAQWLRAHGFQRRFQVSFHTLMYKGHNCLYPQFQRIYCPPLISEEIAHTTTYIELKIKIKYFKS